MNHFVNITADFIKHLTFEDYSTKDMSLKQKLKERPALYNLILSVLNSVDYFNIRFRMLFPKYQITENWKKRSNLVRESEDNQRITHTADAGQIKHDHQVMHNGLKISLASYYDYGNTVLIRDNRGVHEPQEEFAFQEVLKQMPEGSSMLELGSFWAFYSMWFAHEVKGARCIMVEPDPHKMNFGKLNFKLNGLKGHFEPGYIDKDTDLKPRIPVLSVDFLIKKHNIDFLHVLHSDIQGFELKMLKGAATALKEKKIGFVFISTHSNELHEQCSKELTDNGYEIVCSANLDESYSWDGLLVAKKKGFTNLEVLNISKRTIRK